MAETVLCPFCNVDKPKKHQALCGKNPESLTAKRQKKRSVDRATLEAGGVGSTQSPQIVARVDAVPEAKLPDFESQASPEREPHSTGAVPGASPTTQAAGIPTSAIIRPLIEQLFNRIEIRVEAASTGKIPEPVKPTLSKSDRDDTATLWGMVIDKHLPPVVAQKWGLELAAAIHLIAVIVPYLFDSRAYWKYHTKKLEAAKKAAVADHSGASTSYNGNGGDEALKDAYLKAVNEGRLPV